MTAATTTTNSPLLTPYSQDFYAHHQARSHSSAEEVLPEVLKIAQPRSVVDVGCGTGAWLAVALQCGIGDVLGIDGDWVDRSMMQIPDGRFLAHDLSLPLDTGQRFDLVISMEVAEHIAPECADVFVGNLVMLGPVILFSAAVPMQGGTAHVNEQWPEYWSEKFHGRGYTAVDCLRRKLWHNPRVDFWYSQNAFLYVKTEYLDSFGFAADDIVTGDPCAWVHRDLYRKIVEKYERAKAASDPANIPFRKALSTLLTVARAAAERRLGKRR
jgi:SAM-dependent methyltransferase